MSEGGEASDANGRVQRLVAVLHHALQGAETCADYAGAEHGDTAAFFGQAAAQHHALADAARALLRNALDQPAAAPSIVPATGSEIGLNGS